MNCKYHMKSPLWETDPDKAKEGLCKYLERRRKTLLKWQPSNDRAQGIKDELLILINAVLGNDVHLLCIGSLVPFANRKDFDKKFSGEIKMMTKRKLSKNMKEQMADGYRENASEDLALAKEFDGSKERTK